MPAKSRPAVSGTRAWVVAVVAAALVSGWLAAQPAPAEAHARYESSIPADGEVLAEPPERVDIYFNQELARAQGLPTVRVANESGDVIADEAVLDDDDRTHVFIELPPALPEGRYTAIWHNVSDEDGDEAEGAFHFFVGSGPGETPDGPTGEPGGSPTPAGTEPSIDDGNGGDDDDGGVPSWTLALAAVGGLVVGGGAGLVFGRRR